MASLVGIRSMHTNRRTAAAGLQSPRFSKPGGASIRDRAATNAIGDTIG